MSAPRLRHWELANWSDKRVQKVYRVLCSLAQPPEGEHWEGYYARHIVAKLFPDAATSTDSRRDPA